MSEASARIFHRLGLAGLILVGAAAAGHAQQPAPEPKTLKIGFLATMSGGGASYGIAGCRGWQMAASDINAKGGVTVAGQRYVFQPICEDDKVDSAQATAAAQKLFSQDKVSFFGFYSSQATLAGTILTDDKKMLSVSAAGIRQALGPDKPYNFRMYMTQVELGNMFWDWVKKTHPEIKRIALIQRDDAVGQSIGNDIKDILTAHGYEIVATEYTPVTQTDYYPVLTKILAQKPDAFEVETLQPAGIGLIAKQSAELGWKGPLFATGEQPLADTIKVGGADNIAGRYYAATPDYDGPLATPQERELSARYHKQYNNESMSSMTTMAYNGLWIIAQAVQGADSLSTGVLVPWLQTHPVQTVHGPSEFGGKSIYGVPNQLYTPAWISQATGDQWKGIAKTDAIPAP